MRGKKWLMNASYLTASDKEKVMREVQRCKDVFPEHARTVGVRPAAYTGEPHPIATVDYGPGGGSLFSIVYR